MDGIHFKATVKKVQVDDDGEATVILLVPEANKKDALGMAMLTKTIIDVTVTPDTEKKKF
jgi:hypothetical protein